MLFEKLYVVRDACCLKLCVEIDDVCSLGTSTHCT